MQFLLRLNAILMFSLVASYLAVFFTCRPSDHYYSFEIELFRNLLFRDVPCLLLAIYAVLIGLTAWKTGKGPATTNAIVSLILSLPLSLSFFVLAFFCQAYVDSRNSPMAFMLPGLLVGAFGAFLAVSAIFCLANGYLIYFSRKSPVRSGWRSYPFRLLALTMVLGSILCGEWAVLTWQEQCYRYYRNTDEYKILTTIAPDEILLLNKGMQLFVLDVEKRNISATDIASIQEKFPDIAKDVRSNDYNSVDALAPVWLKKYPGYPNIDLTAVSPDGRWKITTSNQGTSLLEETEGKTKPIRLYHGIWVGCQTFTPDGRYVIAQGNSSHIILSDEPIKLDRIIVWRVPKL